MDVRTLIGGLVAASVLAALSPGGHAAPALPSANLAIAWAPVPADHPAQWSDDDCLFGGWPSKRVNGRCEHPATHRGDYQSVFSRQERFITPCGPPPEDLLCSPAFYGEGICVRVQTRFERDNITFNCMRLFRARVVAGVRTEQQVMEAGGKFQAETFDSFSQAARFCSPEYGPLKDTPECRNLIARLVEMDAYQRTGRQPLYRLLEGPVGSGGQ